MRRALAVLAAGLGLAGCGFGPGEGASDVRLEISRDYGAVRIGTLTTKTPGSDTVLRLLERHFPVQTAYGGKFVRSIAGRAGGRAGGRRTDWFYYVNGVEADRGSAATTVEAGDRVLWDLHDWSSVMDTPAIVGQYPEPFLHGTGQRAPTRIECSKGADVACAVVQRRLGEAGVLVGRAVIGTGAGEDTQRVLVGPWSELHKSVVARQLERGPRVSGVFVRPSPGGRSFTLLDARARVVATLGPGTGLVAATRFEHQDPTWLVTGTDIDGVRAAANLLDAATLDRRWAAVVQDGQVTSAPPGPGP